MTINFSNSSRRWYSIYVPKLAHKFFLVFRIFNFCFKNYFRIRSILNNWRVLILNIARVFSNFVQKKNQRRFGFQLQTLYIKLFIMKNLRRVIGNVKRKDIFRSFYATSFFFASISFSNNSRSLIWSININFSNLSQKYQKYYLCFKF